MCIHQDQDWMVGNNHLTSILNEDTTFVNLKHYCHKRQSQIVRHHQVKVQDLVEWKNQYIRHNSLILLVYYKDTKVLTKVLHSNFFLKEIYLGAVNDNRYELWVFSWYVYRKLVITIRLKCAFWNSQLVCNIVKTEIRPLIVNTKFLIR